MLWNATCVRAIFKLKPARESVGRRHAEHAHPSIHWYPAYIMDGVIIPACRHVAPASLLPRRKKAGTTGTQPDYPINLL